MSDRFGRRDDRRPPRDDTRNHRPRYGSHTTSHHTSSARVTNTHPEQDRSRSPRGRDRRDDRRRDRSPPRNAPNSRGGPPSRPDNRDRNDYQRNGPPRGPGGRPDIKREALDSKAGIKKEIKPDPNIMDIAEDEDEEAAMQRIMGFKDFRTTKNTKVPGNDRNYAVHKVKKAEYRQYMNRVGGFNRPLSPSRV